MFYYPVEMKKKKILLIDDDATYIFLVERQLKKCNTVGEIVTACNGSEALDIIKRDYETGTLPQVIIADIEMPIMNGITFSKELEVLKLIDYALTKVILNSCGFKYDTIDWSVESPTVTYFPKPLLNEHLSAILSDQS